MSHPWRTEDFESVYARFKPGGYQLWIFARMYARRRLQLYGSGRNASR